MALNILVTGATGTIGHATIAALGEHDARVAAYVRDPARARAVLGPEIEMRTGDLADEAALRQALAGIDAVLLASGNDPALREIQLTAVRAIAAARVPRAVKISGSAVSIVHADRARTGADHLAVEEALRASGRETVAIRPNVFMQNFLDQAIAIGHGALPGPDGDPRVSFIDGRDVGRVAAAALTAAARPDEILEVTGPEALSWYDAADRMTAVLGRQVTHYPASPEVMGQGLRALGREEWQIEHALELSALFGDPRAAVITDTVARLTGAQPADLTDFLRRHAAELPPAA
ncbi:MAG TPA: NAD(P)H-binding protein [Solirubrobacteraceae bacterium]|nr:NAD(P)H-binding protein [Solirubrobacteraceae bacterium]